MLRSPFFGRILPADGSIMGECLGIGQAGRSFSFFRLCMSHPHRTSDVKCIGLTVGNATAGASVGRNLRSMRRDHFRLDAKASSCTPMFQQRAEALDFISTLVGLSVSPSGTLSGHELFIKSRHQSRQIDPLSNVPNSSLRTYESEPIEFLRYCIFSSWKLWTQGSLLVVFLEKLTTFEHLGIKGKRNKKKKGGGNSKTVESSKDENGSTIQEGIGMDESPAGETERPKSSVLEREGDDVQIPVRSHERADKTSLTNGLSLIPNSLSSTQSVEDLAQEEEFPEDQTDSSGRRNVERPNSGPTSNGSQSEIETSARLDALESERAALRAEVAQLRRSLEEVQERHEEESSGIREQLSASQTEKEHAETQYHNLLGKVNTIKSQLGERLKADAVCLRSRSSNDTLIPE